MKRLSQSAVTGALLLVLAAPVRAGKDAEAGTTLGSAPSGLIAFKGRVYFAASDGVHGVELWASDGTAEGTAMVADINKEPGLGRGTTRNSNPRWFAVLNNKLYFSADDGVHGAELWATDGEKTALVKDINAAKGMNEENAPSPY